MLKPQFKGHLQPHSKHNSKLNNTHVCKKTNMHNEILESVILFHKTNAQTTTF